MDRKQMFRALVMSGGGAPKDLARLCGTNPQDSTFKRALGEAVDARMLFPRGTTQDRHYLSRSDVFPAMAAAAGKGGRTIGAVAKPKAPPS